MHLVAIVSLALLTCAIWGVLRQVLTIGFITLVAGDPRRWSPNLTLGINLIAASVAVHAASYITRSFVADAHIAFAAIGAIIALLTIARQTRVIAIGASMNEDWIVDSQASDERNCLLRYQHVSRVGSAGCMGALIGFATAIGAVLIWGR